jgi:RNA polymerase sigma-70 factor (ECF subfamily)
VARAEDVVQDVFVRVWRSAGTYRPDLGTVRAWLLAIAHHRAIDELRRRRHETGGISLDEAGPEILGGVEDPERDPFVSRAMQALPHEQRQAIDLAYFHGLTVNDIAGRLRIPPGTVKSRIRLGLAKLRAHLGIEQDHEG